jgi:two-component system response regulator
MTELVEILLVEDNDDDAALTIRALEKNNLNSHFHVKGGEEALDFIFARGQHADRDMEHGPKVVVLDLKMPKVSGVDVIRKMKADERTKNIPIVVLSASDNEIDKQTCYELGINSYVVKPTHLEHFYKAMSSVAFRWMITNQLAR